MKIFFAYSSQSALEGQDMCYVIANELKRFGDVFSERFGDWETSELGQKERNREIWRSERASLERADVLVAEVSVPSLGVGYEIGLAEAADKPILCLFRQQDAKAVSAMIAGHEGVMLRPYESRRDLDRVLREFFKSPYSFS